MIYGSPLSSSRIIFKKDSDPGRYRKRKFLIFLKKLFWPAIFLAVAGSIFYFFFFSSYFQISVIKIEGNEAKSLNKSLIQDSVAGFLSSQKYNFFPGSSWFLFSSQGLRARILGEFPKVGEIKINKRFPKTLILAIEEREIAAIWCSDPGEKERQLEIGSECFYADKDGFIFDEAPVGEGSLMLKIQDYYSKEKRLGDSVLGRDIIEKLNRIKNELEKDPGLAIREFRRTEEGDIRAKTEGGFEIYFNMQESIDFQLLSFREVFAKISPEERQNLEYADLRIEGRVYYK